ncbi:MAG: prepilin-type N-terminal cleavage/methylation domain-containing protein [Gammaproteobacteria bacterium]|nr:prepilin-type N-terminal cleavage/methylation domain-containing protein [Gammaproteobacteria bacterium]
MQKQAGFSLPELLLVMLLVAALTTIGVPAFRSLLLDARMVGQVNGFVHGIHLARQEAEKHGADVALCRSTDGLYCNHAQPWQAGFIIFVNRDRDDPPQVDAGESVLQATPAWPGGVITANRSAFVFRPYGKRSVNGTINLCDHRGPGAARMLIVSYTGRPRAIAADISSNQLRCPS